MDSTWFKNIANYKYVESTVDMAMCCPNPASRKTQWPDAGNDNLQLLIHSEKSCPFQKSITSVWWQWSVLSWPFWDNPGGSYSTSFHCSVKAVARPASQLNWFFCPCILPSPCFPQGWFQPRSLPNKCLSC